MIIPVCGSLAKSLWRENPGKSQKCLGSGDYKEDYLNQNKRQRLCDSPNSIRDC
jgi:hypothetical protein